MTNLEFVRRYRRWTQETMARFLGAGFTGSAISLIETGRLKPSARQASRLAEVFGVPTDVLLNERPSFESLKDILAAGEADESVSEVEAP